jgi:hypothetical protein
MINVAPYALVVTFPVILGLTTPGCDVPEVWGVFDACVDVAPYSFIVVVPPGAVLALLEAELLLSVLESGSLGLPQPAARISISTEQHIQRGMKRFMSVGS